MWFLVIPNALAKNMIPLIRQKSLLEENKERGNGPARDVTTEGGSGGASPPTFTRTTITSKSLSEAVFIISMPMPPRECGDSPGGYVHESI